MSHNNWNTWMVQCTMTKESDEEAMKWWRERTAELLCENEKVVHSQ